MSYADKVFKGMCRDILDNGVSTEGWEKVRCPVCGDYCWERPEDAGVIYHSKLDGACCTLCALKKGAGRL